MNASIFVKVSEVEFNQDFIARVIPKIDWDCLCRAAEQLGHLEDLPKVCYDDDDGGDDNDDGGDVIDNGGCWNPRSRSFMLTWLILMFKVAPENYEGDLDFLRKAHHVLLEVVTKT